MADKVILVITDGPIKGQRFVLEEQKRFVFGRGEDCDVSFPSEERKTSRHHFELVVNPHEVQISDLGSLRGTFVNGVKYGGRQRDEKADGVARPQHSPVVLRDGDEIGAGLHVMRVEIELASSSAIGASADAPTLFDEQLDATEIIGSPSPPSPPEAFPKTVVDGEPGDAQPAPHEQELPKTVLLPRSPYYAQQSPPGEQPKRAIGSQKPDDNQAKTVVDRFGSQEPDDDQAKTVVDPFGSQEPDDDQAKTVVDPIGSQEPYDDQAKTVVDPFGSQEPYDDLAKTVIVPRPAHARQQAPSQQAQSKNLVPPAGRKQPSQQFGDTLIVPSPAHRRQQGPSQAQSENVLPPPGREQSSQQFGDTLVVPRPAHAGQQAPLQAQSKNVLPPVGREQSSQELPKTVVLPRPARGRQQAPSQQAQAQA
ncbi:MAG: FHA domain-containing protein, partial [Ardenticatenaceae bacterium]